MRSFDWVPASAGARHLKVRRHLLLRVLRRRASWTRSTPGAPLARPQPPCARRSHPAHPTRRFGTFLPPCIPLRRLHASQPSYPHLPLCSQELNSVLLPRPGSRAACRCVAAVVPRPMWAGGGAWVLRGWPGGSPWGVVRHPRCVADGQKKYSYSGGIFFVPPMEKS